MAVCIVGDATLFYFLLFFLFVLFCFSYLSVLVNTIIIHILRVIPKLYSYTQSLFIYFELIVSWNHPRIDHENDKVTCFYLCIVILYSPELHCTLSSLNLTAKLNVIDLVIICIITWIYNKLCSGCEKWSQLSKVCSTYINYNDQQGETTVQINVLSCNLCSHSLQINLSFYISFSLFQVWR